MNARQPISSRHAPTTRQPVAGTVEVTLLLGDRSRPRLLTPGDALRLGRGTDQDVVLASRWISRHQAVLSAGDGHAVLRRAYGARSAMWVQHEGRDVRALDRGEPILLSPGVTWVRMHTDASIFPATAQILDPLGAPVLRVTVAPAAHPALSAPPQEDLTLTSPEYVRNEPGYLTLVALCVGLVRDGEGGAVPDADELSRQLSTIGSARARGTCGNDLSRMAHLLGLRDGAGSSRNISRYQLAVAAVRAGWVTADDVSAAGFR